MLDEVGKEYACKAVPLSASAGFGNRGFIGHFGCGNEAARTFRVCRRAADRKPVYA
jgi:hypothetical protein